jgi:hypothetical protein
MNTVGDQSVSDVVLCYLRIFYFVLSMTLWASYYILQIRKLRPREIKQSRVAHEVNISKSEICT